MVTEMALFTRRVNRIGPPLAQYVDEPADDVRIGIACSGGGIRSAAFNLGALQALQDRSLLQRSEYLAAVSGGNYVATALTITAATSEDGRLDDPQVWSHGSPEERNLRHHTDYLAPGLLGRLWFALNLLYGFIVNYLPFVLAAFVLGRVVGWGLKDLAGSEPDQLLWGRPSPAARATSAVLLALGGLAIAVGLGQVCVRRLRDGRGLPSNHNRQTYEDVAGLMAAVGMIVVALVTLLPTALVLYRQWSTWLLTEVFAQRASAFDTSTRARAWIAAFWLLTALVLAAVALLMARHGRARRLMLALAGIGAFGMLAVPFLSSLEYSSRRGLSSGRDAASVVVSLAILLAMAVFVHNRRYSMHLFYRERLCRVFAVQRTGQDPPGDAQALDYDKPLRFSDIGHELEARAERRGRRRLPKLVICCAVNVTAHDAPIGRFAGSYTFEANRVGGPLLGYRATSEVEHEGRIKGTALTLPSMMAVSGAALSPVMGRFTQPSIRFLMALTNVRLGVWLPNPHWRSDRRSAAVGSESKQPDSAPQGVWWRRAARTVVDGWNEPGALYVFREALGMTGGNLRFIYVSDGGHFENLGLVELIRRRCTHILCFDATGDRPTGGLDIGRAVALARSDLAADVLLDPSATLAGPDGFAEDRVATGEVRYPNGPAARLVYARAVLTKDSSWDLRSYARRDPRFPNHSTSQQIFTDEQFQAYRSLGYQAGMSAADELNLPGFLLRGRPDADPEADAEQGLAAVLSADGG